MPTHSFSDFDAFADSVRDVDCTMTLQNPTHHRWVINRADLPSTHVQLGRLGSGNIVEGQSWSNGYVLYLPLSDTCAYSANGTVLPTGSFMILEPGCEFCLSSSSNHDWCSLFIPTHELVIGGDLAEPSSGCEKTLCRVTRPNRQAAQQFGALVQQIVAAAAKCPQLESSRAATTAEAELMKIASSILGEQPAGELKHAGRPRLPRQDIIRRSKELLEERRDEPVRVGELAAAAEVSERTLETAFKEYFGTGPVRYLELRHLHQVHRALRAADPEAVSVSDVFVQHGEWQFGRFASRYRRLFGELPSETLRTGRQ